jgi:hypothetical protein
MTQPTKPDEINGQTWGNEPWDRNGSLPNQPEPDAQDELRAAFEAWMDAPSKNGRSMFDACQFGAQWQASRAAPSQELSAVDAITILRGALTQAEYAIKGREHTGFITKALNATDGDYRAGQSAPAQPRNFCPDCGKRTPPDSVHTCTPPVQDQQNALCGSASCLDRTACCQECPEQPAQEGLTDRKAFAYDEWIDKTNWVQEQIGTFGVSALGMHRADVMRKEIERLRALLASQPAAPHTCSAFIGRFSYQNKRQPTQQECFDAGMRSGRDLKWPQPAAPIAVQDDAVRDAAFDLLSEIRSLGLSVAVHNDYRLNGEAYTFWLFTDVNGMSYKGEGKTDHKALTRVIMSMKSTQPSAAPAEAAAAGQDEAAWTDEQCHQLRETAAINADLWAESHDVEPTAAQVSGVFVRAILAAERGGK